MRHECSRRGVVSRRCPATVEPLESRALLTSVASVLPTSIFYMADTYNQFVNDLTTIEQRSQATPAEYLALRDDARAVSAATASTTLGPVAAAASANALTVELDRSALDGWMGDDAWSAVLTRAEASMQSLGAHRPL